MKSEYRLHFLTEQHKTLTDNLNHISGDLLRAKWFFLATIAAVGTAYIKIISSTKVVWGSTLLCGFGQITESVEGNWFALIIVCLIGNIIFWLISEYALSHAFLFRFIQSKLAKIEKDFDTPGTSKDPSELSYFIKENRGKIFPETDYIIPDQFVPIYWASSWLILINTLVMMAFVPDKTIPMNIIPVFIKINNWTRFLFFLFLSMPFIWKLWTYHCYKLNKFINEHCNFKIKYCPRSFKINIFKKFEDDFFALPQLQSLFGIVMALLILIIYCFYQEEFFIKLAVLFLLIAFWPVIFGFIIHFFRTIIRVDLPKLRGLLFFTPELKLIDGKVPIYYLEKNSRFSHTLKHILAVLYTIT